MVKNKKGFTLIELIIVVAIIGILAAIAMPVYLHYTVKARITEVTTAMDGLAQAASAYHESAGYFPLTNDANYTNTNTFAPVSIAYASWNYTRQDANYCTFTATFVNLQPVNGCTLVMTITFAPGTGYSKVYDTVNSTIAPKYIP
jgi:prepilin-type N-terminal cleavage/methylation domain-containing protein